MALDIIIALKHNNADAAQRSANRLTAMLPDEIVPHMMYIDAYFNKLSQKEYAKEVMNYLKVQDLNFNDLYFGAW